MIINGLIKMVAWVEKNCFPCFKSQINLNKKPEIYSRKVHVAFVFFLFPSKVQSLEIDGLKSNGLNQTFEFEGGKLLSVIIDQKMRTLISRALTDCFSCLSWKPTLSAEEFDGSLV